ncbi:MAG: GMC family oxidoreductase [Pseudomonadota bacterium]
MSFETLRDSDDVFDALVIGSGVTGGWAAKEFCERGYRTLMIERGPLVEHRKDYPHESKPPWDMPQRGRVPLAEAEQRQAVQKNCYAYNDFNRQFFGDDRDLPYSTASGTRFTWYRGNQLGGKSLIWARQSYRLSEFDFEANAKDGHGNDWPLRYADLAPWYAHVERHAGISGARDGLPQIPDSESLPPFDMTAPERAIGERIEAAFPDRNFVIGRTANLSQPTQLHLEQGRVACQARTECDRGCSFGAYFSTQSSTLPAAARTGKLAIAPNSVVHSLIFDEASGRVRGVRVIDADDRSERRYFGRVVFLCASTLGSTQLLLHSTSRSFPTGLANRSGVLGRYLMDHNYNAFISARVPGFEDAYYRGRRPTGIYVPNFHYEPGRYHRDFQRGYALGGSAYRVSNWRGGAARDGFGADFKEALTGTGDWGFNFYAQGEMLPRAENQVTLHPSNKDKWGIPQLHFDVRWSDNERRMMESAAEEGTAMMRAAGLEAIEAHVQDGAPGAGIHEMGTARMGRDPASSVFNGFNQAHDIDNLFCTDGSVFCSSATQNPSLTYMALTARAVAYAVDEMKNRRI